MCVCVCVRCPAEVIDIGVNLNAVILFEMVPASVSLELRYVCMHVCMSVCMSVCPYVCVLLQASRIDLHCSFEGRGGEGRERGREGGGQRERDMCVRVEEGREEREMKSKISRVTHTSRSQSLISLISLLSLSYLSLISFIIEIDQFMEVWH